MVTEVKNTVSVELPTREIQDLLKAWNELVKEQEKLFASQADLNKVMKDNAGIVAVLIKNSKNLTKADREQLKETQLTLKAQKTVNIQREESARIQQQIARERQKAAREQQAQARETRQLALRQLAAEEETERRRLATVKAQSDAARNLARLREETADRIRKAEDEVTRAQERQERSLAALIKRSLLWAAGTASLFFLFRKLRNAVADTVRELFKNTEEYKRLTEASEFARKATIGVIADTLGAKIVMDGLAQSMTALGQLSLLAGAGLKQLTADIVGMTQAALDFNFFELMVRLFSPERMQESVGEAQQQIKEWLDLINASEDEVNKLESAIKSLVNQSFQFDKAMEKNAQSLRDIQTEYENTIITIQNEASQALQDIESDLADNISDINESALEDHQKALGDFNKSIIKAQERANKTVADNAKRHQLAMEFAQRRHNLTQLQNQRIFEFERNLLVADGDVLAIEELDARHKLEQEAAEENFRLQQQQAKAMARLQAQIIGDAIRDQLGELKAGLAEQLAEIESSRREEIAEAEERAEELRQQEMRAATERFIEAELEKQKRIDQVKDEEQKLLDANAEFLAQLARDTETDFEDVVSAWEAIYGPSAELATLVEETYRLIEGRTFLFAQTLTNAINGIQFNLNLPATLQGLGGGRGSGRGGGIGRGRFPGFQFGGDFIASQPQLIEVGHGPERVTVQPLSAIGMSGSMTHRWGGGAIPVQGQGSMGNADLGAIGNQIARGMISSMRTKVRDTGRKRGT